MAKRRNGPALAWAIRLYPRAWRDRYEEEFLAVLEQHPATAMTVLDVALGALDAHLFLHLEAGRVLSMTARLRTAVITVLWSWVGFVIVGMGFQKLSEDPPYHALAMAHATVGLSFNLIVAGAVASALAMAAGGLPIAYTAFRSALAERRHAVLALFALPFVLLGVALGVTMVLAHQTVPAAFRANPGLGFGAIILLWVGAAAASTLAGSVVVARTEIGERLFTLALRWGVIVTLAMAAVTVANGIWGLGLRQYAPELYFGHGGLLRSITWSSWLRNLGLMALFTALAVQGLVRGFRSRSAADGPGPAGA